MFRKLRLIELGVRQLTGENSEKMIYLAESLSLQEVADKRYELVYYETIIQGEFAMNIEDIKRNEFFANQLLGAVLRSTKLSLDSAEAEAFNLSVPVTFKIQ